VGIVAEILKGLDFEEATVLVLLLVLLVRSRKEFDRRATLLEHTFSGGWFAAVSLVVLASVVLGVYAFRHSSEGQFDWYQFKFGADESRFLRATVGVAIVLLAVGIRFLLRSSAPTLQLPAERDLADAERVIAGQDSSTPYLLYLNDKAILWNESRTAFLMYAVGGRTWVVMGDPVGPSTEVRGLIRRFLEMVDDADGVPVFYQVRKDNLHRYADFGLVFAKAGEEALVPLSSFSLEGGARKKMRLFQHKLEKDGATYRIVSPADVPAILPELRQISDEWLAMKAGSEKGFSLGFFNESYLKRFPIVVLEVAGRIEAFASIWPGPGKVELSVDLMRHRPSAPKNAMEGVFIYLMQWGKGEGYHTFNLGMVALSGLEHSEFAPFWTTFASYIYRYGRTFYNFEGLRAYKDKFDPIWEPKYLAYPGGRALPLVMLDVSALIAGGYRRVLLR
jgi:phosphatidylglycerol lysyltransferase